MSKSKHTLYSNIWYARKRRREGKRCTAPLEIKVKLKRYKLKSYKGRVYGKGFGVKRKIGKKWVLIGRYDLERDAVERIEQGLGLTWL